MPQPPVPSKATYFAYLVEWAGYLKTWYENNNVPPSDQGLANAFYDLESSAFKIRDHTGNATWDPWIQSAFDAYVTYYVLPNNGAVQGFRNFTEGQLEDVLRSTSRSSSALNSIQLQLANGAYVASSSENIAVSTFSREVAYGLLTHINAERAGILLTGPQLARRSQLLDFALGHIQQWAVNYSAPYYRPFMGGITAKALIAYFTHVAEDSRIVPAIKTLADYTWSSCWKANSGAWGQGNSFLYTDRVLPNNVEPQDGFTHPTLNMLIAPMFGFVWWRTGIQQYRTQGDAIFLGGLPNYSGGFHVSGSDLGTQSPTNPYGKQYNQQLFWGPDYITWAESDPVVGQTNPTGNGGGGAGGGGGGGGLVVIVTSDFVNNGADFQTEGGIGGLGGAGVGAGVNGSPGGSGLPGKVVIINIKNKTITYL